MEVPQEPPINLGKSVPFKERPDNPRAAKVSDNLTRVIRGAHAPKRAFDSVRRPKKAVKKGIFKAVNSLKDSDDLEAERQITRAEAENLYNQWKVMSGGKAGIPSTWMFKRIKDMTLAESIAFHKAIQSGRTWGEIQFDGLGPDRNSELTPEEYEFCYGYRC